MNVSLRSLTAHFIHAKVLSCSGLGCSDNAECVLDSDGGPTCACLPGFEGDGTGCAPVPSKVRMKGYSQPEEIVYAAGVVLGRFLKLEIAILLLIS